MLSACQFLVSVSRALIVDETEKRTLPALEDWCLIWIKASQKLACPLTRNL